MLTGQQHPHSPDREASPPTWPLELSSYLLLVLKAGVSHLQGAFADVPLKASSVGTRALVSTHWVVPVLALCARCLQSVDLHLMYPLMVVWIHLFSLRLSPYLLACQRNRGGPSHLREKYLQSFKINLSFLDNFRAPSITVDTLDNQDSLSTLNNDTGLSFFIIFYI